MYFQKENPEYLGTELPPDDRADVLLLPVTSSSQFQPKRAAWATYSTLSGDCLLDCSTNCGPREEVFTF
jgi:hypothetical protein